MNPTLIETHATPILLQRMIVMAAAWLSGKLGKTSGRPIAVGEILADIELGPAVLGLFRAADWPYLDSSSTMGRSHMLHYTYGK